SAALSPTTRLLSLSFTFGLRIDLIQSAAVDGTNPFVPSNPALYSCTVFKVLGLSPAASSIDSGVNSCWTAELCALYMLVKSVRTRIERASLAYWRGLRVSP